jgi:hypothetical protein
VIAVTVHVHCLLLRRDFRDHRLGPMVTNLNQRRSLLRHRSHFAGSAIAGTSSNACVAWRPYRGGTHLKSNSPSPDVSQIRRNAGPPARGRRLPPPTLPTLPAGQSFSNSDDRRASSRANVSPPHPTRNAS